MRIRGCLLGLVLAGCSPSSEPGVSSVASDSLGVRTTVTDAQYLSEGRSLGPIADTIVEVGSATDAPGSALLYRVAAADFNHDGDLVVLHGGTSLQVFDERGALILEAGGPGNGPGEFVEATDFRVMPTGEIVVWDAQTGRLTTFAADGIPLGSSQANLEAITARFPRFSYMQPEARWRLWDSDQLLIFSYKAFEIPEEGLFRPLVDYVLTPFDGSSTEVLGEFRGVEQLRTRATSGGSSVVISADPDDTHVAAGPDGRMFIGDGGSSVIHRFDSSGRLDLRVTFEQVDRSPVRVSRIPNQESLRGIGSDPAPAFRGLVADRAGNLWVRLGQQPKEGGAYAVFDSEGMFVGRTSLPPHDRILSISDDRIAALHRSTLDIESIVVYSLPW